MSQLRELSLRAPGQLFTQMNKQMKTTIQVLDDSKRLRTQFDSLRINTLIMIRELHMPANQRILESF